ncbi:MAG: PTPA-CTERM sorting domain-containing protein [Limnothrix sp. RL_2_0]|nr:PTPA-CTERM sorting domain-containing protein [Limnothrix sp. RL_2_0]
MKKQLILGAIATSVLTLGTAVIAPSADAFSLSASSLETNGNPDAESSWFDISLKTNGDGTATFSFGNVIADGNGTKISTIYFGDDDYFSSIFDTSGTVSFDGSTSPGTNYSFDWSASGGSQISNNNGGAWQVVSSADPKNGSNKSTINPGDILKVTFDLVNSSTSDADLLAAFVSTPQKLGVAFHVQSIEAQGYSEWYEALPIHNPVNVPTPAAVLPIIGSMIGAASRRKSASEESESNA